MALRKKALPPTFEERLAGAQAEAASAVSVFETIAADLEKAAESKDELAAEIYSEIDRLHGVIDNYTLLLVEAEGSAHASREQATNVRALMGN